MRTGDPVASGPAPLQPSGRRRGLLALALTVGAAAPLNAGQIDDGQLQRLRADCRVEGEAGGLRGAGLERFIAQCVADLQTVEIRHIDRD
jgi:hypothetical protein